MNRRKPCNSQGGFSYHSSTSIEVPGILINWAMAPPIWEVVYFESYAHLLSSPACCNSVNDVTILYSHAEISRWAGSLLQTYSSRTVRKMHRSSPQDIGGHGLCIENRSKADTHVIVSMQPQI